MSGQDTSADVEQAVEASQTGLVLRVRAHAGARCNGVTGVRETELCVAVTAPADRGKANDALTRVLAKVLGVGRSRIELLSGAANRHKRFAVRDLSVSEGAEALRNALVNGR